MKNIINEILLRDAVLDDIEGLLNVEKQAFTLPWTREAFFHELTNNQYAVYTVLEYQQQIIGYCGAWIIIDEAHITNIAVLPAYQGKKLGEALLAKMMQTAKEMGAFIMSLEVRVSNQVAQSLYQKLGFQKGGIRKHYYSDNHEDAQVMWVTL